MTLLPDWAAGWTEEQRHELYVSRERVVIESLDSPGGLTAESLRDDQAKLVAVFTLMHEGFIEPDVMNPTSIRLTETGRRFALGASALRNG